LCTYYHGLNVTKCWCTCLELPVQILDCDRIVKFTARKEIIYMSDWEEVSLPIQCDVIHRSRTGDNYVQILKKIQQGGPPLICEILCILDGSSSQGRCRVLLH
jgi:hypothetical protein